MGNVCGCIQDQPKGDNEFLNNNTESNYNPIVLNRKPSKHAQEFMPNGGISFEQD